MLIATGSSYRRLGIPGEDDLIGAGVHFCATCDGPFYRGADELLVIGGGNSALEEGLFLRKFATRIRIVQREPELTASRLLQDKVTNDPHFVVHRNTEVVELAGKGRLESVRLRDRASGEEQVVTPRAAFVFIGLDPNTAFLRGSVDLDARGFVDDKGGFTTSVPGVFAAGRRPPRLDQAAGIGGRRRHRRAPRDPRIPAGASRGGPALRGLTRLARVAELRRAIVRIAIWKCALSPRTWWP